MIQYFNAGAMSVALDLARAEVRRMIVELEVWSRLSPSSQSVNGVGDDGFGVVTTMTSMARIVDGKGVEHVLNKIEARELCSKAAVEMFAAPVYSQTIVRAA